MNASQFKNRFVRDLAWAISSPNSIMHAFAPEPEFWQNEYQKFLPQLVKLDSAPEKLELFLARTKRRALGVYFEDLIEFWLQNRPNTKVLARGLQIQDGKTTIGECDFVVELDGVVTHFEVGIKFYLAIKNSAEQNFWVGRAFDDRLDIKLEKMFEQQLQLSSTKAAKQVFAEKILPPVEQKLAMFKGYFFEHFFTQPHQLPTQCNPSNERAFWCSIDEIEQLPKNFLRWQILHKPHWLSFDDAFFNVSELKEKIQSYFAEVKNTPVLCNCLVEGQATKFFISPLSWRLQCPASK